MFFRLLITVLIAIILTPSAVLAEKPAWGPSALADTTYEVTLRCDFKAAVAAGKYYWVYEGIVESTPPEALCREGAKVQVRLFHFGRSISSDGAIAEMDKRGYRPATWPEFLALGANHPNLQKVVEIVGLGSVWRGGLLGFRKVPFLNAHGSQRNLLLDLFGRSWGKDWLFAAVRK